MRDATWNAGSAAADPRLMSATRAGAPPSSATVTRAGTGKAFHGCLRGGRGIRQSRMTVHVALRCAGGATTSTNLPSATYTVRTRCDRTYERGPRGSHRTRRRCDGLRSTSRCKRRPCAGATFRPYQGAPSSCPRRRNHDSELTRDTFLHHLLPSCHSFQKRDGDPRVPISTAGATRVRYMSDVDARRPSP